MLARVAKEASAVVTPGRRAGGWHFVREVGGERVYVEKVDGVFMDGVIIFLIENQ